MTSAVCCAGRGVRGSGSRSSCGRESSGEYAADGHLPGVKALAVERGLSPSTVKRAFDLMREWGLILGAEGERPRVRAVSATEGQRRDGVRRCAVKSAISAGTCP
ncbi:GntR family transcriptional regulator [Pseudonocardia sp. DSM 110487]|nr:GntR family transcriptional regulator [Pseudonocardia sp. DSM 110487]